MNELEQKLEDFKKELESKTLEELYALEKEVVLEAQNADKEAADKTFILKETDGSALKATARTAYGTIIANFLGKSNVNWQQALMVNLIIEFWKGKDLEIMYPVLDNTLRMLGQVQFSGVQEFAQVAKVNDFFEAIRKEFMEFTDKLYEIANRHTAIAAEIQLRTTEEGTPEVSEETSEKA